MKSSPWVRFARPAQTRGREPGARLSRLLSIITSPDTLCLLVCASCRVLINCLHSRRNTNRTSPTHIQRQDDHRREETGHEPAHQVGNVAGHPQQDEAERQSFARFKHIIFPNWSEHSVSTRKNVRNQWTNFGDCEMSAEFRAGVAAAIRERGHRWATFGTANKKRNPL